MVDAGITNRLWLAELEHDVARLRCSYRRHRKRIVQFTVQLEISHAGQWQAIVRYDNAHGFCRRDTIHADGIQVKEPVYYGDVNETFTRAVDELRENWREHWARSLREIRP
jgi:hypothetical protein